MGANNGKERATSHVSWLIGLHNEFCLRKQHLQRLSQHALRLFLFVGEVSRPRTMGGNDGREL